MDSKVERRPARARAVLVRIKAFVFTPPRLAGIVAAVLATTIFAVPMLQSLKPGSASWPAFLLSGDIRMQLFPQYIYGYYRFWHGGLFGPDFATDGGASIFGFRPNMLQFYPPYLASYLFIDGSRPRAAAAVISTLILLHMAVGAFFLTRFANRFLGFGVGASVLLALTYALSYTTCQYYFFYLYFFQIALVPVVAYCLCCLMVSRRLSTAILVSPVFLIYLLTNYGPTMGMGLLIALVLGAFVFWTEIRPQFTGDAYRRLALPLVSLGIAVAVAAPLYLAEQRYHDIASTVPRDIDTTAFQGAFNGSDIVSAFSWLLPGGTPTEGALHWGLLPPAILLAGLFVMLGDPSQVGRLRILILGSLGLFFAFVFVTFGERTTGADMFYTLIPIFGSMHLFQRYLMFAQIFLWFAMVGSAQIFTAHATVAQRQTVLIGAFGLWLVATLAIGLNPDAGKFVNIGWLLPELLAFLCGVIILTFGRGSLSLVVLALPIVATSVWPVFGESRSLGVADFWKSHLGYSKKELADLSQSLQAGQDKQLTKFVDLTHDIDSYLTRNEPWILFSRRPVMNFLGYEPHLSMERSYLDVMGGAYGHFARNYLLKTGIDTVVWNAASEGDFKALTADTVTVTSTESFGPDLQISHLHYDAVPETGEILPLIALTEENPSFWQPSPLEGFSLDGGRVVKIQDGKPGQFSIPVAPLPEQTYDVSLDVLGSTKGSLTLAFGNVGYPEPISAAAPGSYTRRYKAKEPGGLWVHASPDFDGYVTNIIIRQVSPTSLDHMVVVADNGVLRLEAPDRHGQLKDFSTNWTNKISANIEVSSPARLVYQLWPNRYLVPSLDGNPLSWSRTVDGLGYFELPTGAHHFELRFNNWLASVFTALSYLYIGLVIVTFIGVLARRRLREAWTWPRPLAGLGDFFS